MAVIWKHQIAVVFGEADPTEYRLFIGTATEVLDEIKAEFKELDPDLYDKKSRDWWLNIWRDLEIFKKIRLGVARDTLRSQSYIWVHRFLQEE